MKVRAAMSSQEPRWVRPDDNILSAAEAMKRADTGFMPVCDQHGLVGVITDRDIVLRCLAEGHVNVLNEAVSHYSRLTLSASPRTPTSNARPF